MKRSWGFRVGLVAALGFSAVAAQADYFRNSDLKEGLAGWHDDGSIAFLKPDGTEGSEDDQGVTPVIKIVLSSSHPRIVSQEFETHDPPNTLHVKVEVMASSDFQRGKPDDDALGWKPDSVWYWSGLEVPDVDFWIRGGPGWFYKLASLKPGQWVTVDGVFDAIKKTEDHIILFCVPAGQGTVYLKNPLVE